MKNRAYKNTRIDRYCFSCKEIKQQQMLNMHKTYCLSCQGINSTRSKRTGEARELKIPSKLGQLTTEELFNKAATIYEESSLKDYDRRGLIELLKKEGF